jgi:hypothetical protein
VSLVGGTGPGCLGLGRELLCLSFERHICHFDCHDLGVFDGRAGRESPLRGCGRNLLSPAHDAIARAESSTRGR